MVKVIRDFSTIQQVKKAISCTIKATMASKKSLSHKITFLLFLTYLILFNFLIPKAYADCIVDTVQFDIGGRAGSGVTAVDHGNPITLAEIKDWDTSGDDV